MTLTMVDRLAAWGAALIGPPLSGTSLLKRVTSATPSGRGDSTNERERATALAALTERRVRLVARVARAPHRLGLPVVPGWRDTCLSRAYAATLALRGRGIPAILAIGVRADAVAGQGVAAHAWVTLDGRPLVDSGAGAYAELTQGEHRPAEQPTA